MAITAQSIIQRAVGVLQDTTSVRWPVDELVRWLNDGQREVVLYRPDANNVTTNMPLVAGTKQDLGSAGLTLLPAKLIEVIRNNSVSSKAAVRLVPRQIMDAQTPGWHSVAASATVVHYMFDARDPKTFYVYPPATTSAVVEIMYSAFPASITEPANGATFSSVTGNIGLPDIYGNALLDYILYRAYSKDSEYAGNAQRAQAHFGAFTNCLGAEIKATMAVQPQLRPGMQQVQP